MELRTLKLSPPMVWYTEAGMRRWAAWVKAPYFNLVRVPLGFLLAGIVTGIWTEVWPSALAYGLHGAIWIYGWCVGVAMGGLIPLIAYRSWRAGTLTPKKQATLICGTAYHALCIWIALTLLGQNRCG